MTLTGLNSAGSLVFNNNGQVLGGTINLSATNALVNNAPGLTTLASAVNLSGTGTQSWLNNTSGTLNIAGAVTANTSNLALSSGNYTMGSSGSITIGTYPSSYTLNLNNTPGGTTNFTQTGGSIYIDEIGNLLTLSPTGNNYTTNYTVSGGTVTLVPHGLTHTLVVGNGTGTNNTLTINGASAFLNLPGLAINNVTGGSGTVNLANGTLQTDYIFTTSQAPGTSVFNFSGGTLQPIYFTAAQEPNTGAIIRQPITSP